MDALSDLLRVWRFTGGVFLDAKFRAPWCVRSQVTAEDCGPGAQITGGLVGFHYVLAGRVQLRLGKEPPRNAAPGALLLMVRNDAHLLGSDVTLPPMNSERLVHKTDTHELAHIDFGDGPNLESHLVCGYLATAVQAHPLLEALPPVLVADVRERPSAEWVESSFRYAAREHAARRPGSQDVLARLSELLFVEAVREYIETLPADATGWLAALRDPPLSRALASLHARPGHTWTTDALAGEAFLSRSAFAERFTRTLGLPPMSYLARWRMLLAGQRLRESPATIAQIAADMGYESESTFSRAFAREMGVAPGAYRRGANEIAGSDRASAKPL